MFGVSFGELIVVALVGVLVLKPEDVKNIYRQLKKLLEMLHKEKEGIKNILENIDLEDKTYDVNEVLKLDITRKPTDSNEK